jgi:hypothetical protein
VLAGALLLAIVVNVVLERLLGSTPTGGADRPAEAPAAVADAAPRAATRHAAPPLASAVRDTPPGRLRPAGARPVPPRSPAREDGVDVCAVVARIAEMTAAVADDVQCPACGRVADASHLPASGPADLRCVVCDHGWRHRPDEPRPDTALVLGASAAGTARAPDVSAGGVGP